MSNQNPAPKPMDSCPECGSNHISDVFPGLMGCGDCHENFEVPIKTISEPYYQPDAIASPPIEDGPVEPVVHLGGCFVVIGIDEFFGEEEWGEPCPYCQGTGLRADGLEYCEYCEGNGDLD